MKNTDQQIFLACSKLVGVPYEKLNCWELVREFYRRSFAIELQAYYEGPTPSPKEVRALIHAHLSDFVRVDGPPRFGDIILLRLSGIESHIGVFLKNSQFIHSVEGAGVAIDRLDRWHPNVVGYYRYQHKEAA